jgi:prolipoprotein diacylglyceryltransferase
MHPTLFHIPLVVAGAPVFGFGLLLAMWTLACVVFLIFLARKQGFNADTLTYIPMFALVGAAIWWVLPALCNDRGFPIRGYGMMILLGVLAGMALTIWRGRRVGLNSDRVLTLAFWLFLPGLIGARAFYVIEYWSSQYWPYYQQSGLMSLLGAVLNVAQGGLVVYGGFLGLVAGLLAYIKIYRIAILDVCDLIAPGMMIGLAWGRVGCMFFGCCFGDLCGIDALSVRFPWGSPVQIRQAERGQIFLHGLKVLGDPDDPPVIAEVEPGSAAEQQGLAAGQRIVEINGAVVERVSDAQAALLGAERLHLELKGKNNRTSLLSLDAPPSPAAAIYDQGKDQLTIGGLTIKDDESDSPIVAEVQRGSWADLAGHRPGERVIAVNGRPVRTVPALGSFLNEQHQSPSIAVKTAGIRPIAQWTIERPLPGSLPVYPTQIFDSINALLLCLLLLAVEPFIARKGATFAMLMTVYPVTRFLIERIRCDEAKTYFAGMTISQTISLLILAFAAGLWLYIFRRPRATTRV